MSPFPDPLADQCQAGSPRRAVFLAAGAVAAPVIAIVVMGVVAGILRPVSPLPRSLHQSIIGLATVLVLYEAGRRVVLRAPAAWFLVGRPGRHVMLWAVVGFIFPMVVLGIQLALVGATAVGTPPTPEAAIGYVVSSLAAGFLAGVLEELAFRGVLLRILEVHWGPRLAVGTSAALFALLHQGHATGGIELALVLSAMFAAGLLLGVVVVTTRSVWNAVVLHAGWNTIFGGQLVAVAPSGVDLRTSIFQFRLAAQTPFLTGGDATLGAAPLTTAMLLAATLVVWRVGRSHETVYAAVAEAARAKAGEDA